MAMRRLFWYWESGCEAYTSRKKFHCDQIAVSHNLIHNIYRAHGLRCSGMRLITTCICLSLGHNLAFFLMMLFMLLNLHCCRRVDRLLFNLKHPIDFAGAFSINDVKLDCLSKIGTKTD
jgi:hypothetical protein